MVLILLLVALPFSVIQAKPRDNNTVITLSAALTTAKKNQPSLKVARFQTDQANSRAIGARAPLLPQISARAFYVNNSGDKWNGSVSASQLIYDFGKSSSQWRAAQATAESRMASEKTQELEIAYNVRSAFFNARAQQALVQVARETLANQEKRLQQTQAFVEVGTRPAIDLAQASTDVANARVKLIQAENSYAISKAQLNVFMGIVRDTQYELSDDSLPYIAGEEEPLDILLKEALRSRPELASWENQQRAQELELRSARGSYLPSLEVSTSLSFQNPAQGPDNSSWDWSAQAGLIWPIFQGGATTAQVRAARAGILEIQAQKESQSQQVVLQVEQAILAIRAAKAEMEASQEAKTNAQEQLRLAQERYRAGAGSAIELGDAQVAFSNASAQRVGAEYSLASARAQLLRALGRS